MLSGNNSMGPKRWDRVRSEGNHDAQCGDAADGPIGTVVDAIATGKKTAFSIINYLNHESKQSDNDSAKIAKYDSINLNYFKTENRPEQKQLPFEEIKNSFQEVNLGLSAYSAKYETERCFSCGFCTACDICLIYCPDVAISENYNGTGYEINYDFCKGCGLCVEECPRNAMTFEEELKWKTV